MARSGVLLFLSGAAVLSVALSGCLDEAGIDTGALTDQLPDGNKALPGFAGMDCYEGGFVAAYKMGLVGETTFAGGAWTAADIWEEIGKPMRDGTGAPNPPGQALTGNWHEGIKCKSATFNGQTFNDFMFGYVGDAIEAPAWDPGGADLHFLVSVTSVQESPAHDALKQVSKAGISGTTEARIDYLAGDLTMPRFATYVVFSTHDNGVYDSYSEMAPYRDVEPRTVRLWWTVPADGSASPLGSHHIQEIPEGTKWNPVYFDIVTQGGPQWTTPPVDSVEVACHSGIDDHGPQGAACQPTHTVIYRHESLEFRFGGLLKDTVLDQYWHH